MPTWSGILQELAESRKEGGRPDFDAVRRKYLTAFHQHSGRNLILYATKDEWGQVSTFNKVVDGNRGVVGPLKVRPLFYTLNSAGIENHQTFCDPRRLHQVAGQLNLTNDRGATRAHFHHS